VPHRHSIKKIPIVGWAGLLALVLVCPASASADTICATDAQENALCLDRPAKRVVSLSPGATELLFSAGAGDQIKAVSAWSDYPPAAEDLPQVGDSNRLDLEAIVSLKPDLVVAWMDGNSLPQLERIQALGIPVFWLKPRTFEDIASAVETLAVLTGHAELGLEKAADFRQQMDQLEQQYRNASPISVFYQVWHQPLMTINNKELIGRVIQLCGGANVFGELPRLVPRVSIEAVLEADPMVIVTGGDGEDDRGWLNEWQRFPELTAVAKDNLFLVSPSLIQRPTLRMLEGATEFCQVLEHARARV